jgi:hypothetical protein
MSDQDAKSVPPKSTANSFAKYPKPRSALHTSVTAAEIKGMRSIRRLGRDAWEALAEAQRMAVARARRLFPRTPTDAK